MTKSCGPWLGAPGRSPNRLRPRKLPTTVTVFPTNRHGSSANRPHGDGARRRGRRRDRRHPQQHFLAGARPAVGVTAFQRSDARVSGFQPADVDDLAPHLDVAGLGRDALGQLDREFVLVRLQDDAAARLRELASKQDVLQVVVPGILPDGIDGRQAARGTLRGGEGRHAQSDQRSNHNAGSDSSHIVILLCASPCGRRSPRAPGRRRQSPLPPRHHLRAGMGKRHRSPGTAEWCRCRPGSRRECRPSIPRQ